MTTIAYAKGVMACDSAWSNLHEVVTRRSKIVRLKSGALLGEAGDDDSRDMQQLLNNVKSIRQMPTRKELMDLKISYQAILVLPRGNIFSIESDYDEERKDWFGSVFEVNEPFFAAGSGMPYALAIMEFGGSARDAVMVACRRDKNSRTPIHTMVLNPNPAVKKTGGK